MVFLTDDAGQPLTTQDQTTACFRNYFNDLFTSQLHQSSVPLQNGAHSPVSSSSDDLVLSAPDKDEIWNILKNMKKDAAPGPAGLNVAFYRAAWSWIGDDVTTLVRNFYSYGVLPADKNKTFIVLIPKRNAPVRV